MAPSTCGMPVWSSGSESVEDSSFRLFCALVSTVTERHSTCRWTGVVGGGESAAGASVGVGALGRRGSAGSTHSARWVAARCAILAFHAILLRLFLSRLPSLAFLLVGLVGLVLGGTTPLLKKDTCSSPSLNSSTYRAHIPFAQHCR
jgi:hypothetical protein